jgi:hypothetical protein
MRLAGRLALLFTLRPLSAKVEAKPSTAQHRHLSSFGAQAKPGWRLKRNQVVGSSETSWGAQAKHLLLLV